MLDSTVVNLSFQPARGFIHIFSSATVDYFRLINDCFSFSVLFYSVLYSALPYTMTFVFFSSHNCYLEESIEICN